jgi:hypothetical protein
MKGLYITALLLLLNFVSRGQDILLWNEKIPLQWADFLGKVNDQSKFDAEAFTSVKYSYLFDSAGNYSFTVQACFDRTTSWIKQERSCENLLQHEQAHFSISQLYARKLTIAFESYDYTANFQNEILKIFKRIEIDYHQTQRLFDEETNHSLNSSKVKEWEVFIIKELTGAYSKTDPLK